VEYSIPIPQENTEINGMEMDSMMFIFHYGTNQNGPLDRDIGTVYGFDRF